MFTFSEHKDCSYLNAPVELILHLAFVAPMLADFVRKIGGKSLRPVPILKCRTVDVTCIACSNDAVRCHHVVAWCVGSKT